MKRALKLSVALLLAASTLAPATAQTNPDPWANPWVEPYASNLAQLMQLAGTNVFDPDLKAKIQALGPTVQVVDVPMGFLYLDEGFEQDALNDNYYYDLFDFRRVNSRDSFGSGPLAKWKSTGLFSSSFNNPPVILNVDGNGPLGKDHIPSAFQAYMGYDDYKHFSYNEFDASSPDGVGHYATNLIFDAPSKMYTTFKATCSGMARFSSSWSVWDFGGISSSNDLRPWLPGYLAKHATTQQIRYSIYNVPNPSMNYGSFAFPGNILASNSSGQIENNGANPNWTRATAQFPVTAGNTYAVVIDLSNGSAYSSGANRAVDDIRVSNAQTCTKTIPNLFYKPPNTGPNIGGLDLSNVTVTQAEAVNPKVIFDPKTTIYFPPTDPQIGPGACCGPFSEKDIANLLFPSFPNGANNAYTMQYTANATLDAQMTAWLNYVHSQDPTITTITIDWSVANLGSGASPVNYGPFVPAAPNQSVTWTWTPNGVTSSGGNFWTGAPFNINSWYGFMTKISHNGTADSPLFGANCIQNWWKFRVQGTNKIMSPGGNSGPLTYQAVGSDGRVRAIERKPAPRSIR